VARDGELRACYEASGAGYVLHRALHKWGYACEVIAPSLIPKRSGVQRKHDKRDAADLARLYRAGELVAVRIPSEAEERVRDVIRCRETFQREILKSLMRRSWYDVGARQHRRLILLICADYRFASAARQEADSSGAGSF
jgi:transposase